jgi:hypothetical protein
MNAVTQVTSFAAVFKSLFAVAVSQPLRGHKCLLMHVQRAPQGNP